MSTKVTNFLLSVDDLNSRQEAHRAPHQDLAQAAYEDSNQQSGCKTMRQKKREAKQVAALKLKQTNLFQLYASEN